MLESNNLHTIIKWHVKGMLETISFPLTKFKVRGNVKFDLGDEKEVLLMQYFLHTQQQCSGFDTHHTQAQTSTIHHS